MNLFPREKRPFLIWAPPYTHKSSGVRTLHLLCHALNEVGEKAYIVPSSYTGFSLNPHLNTPLLSIQHQNFYGDNFIAVYSDVVKGNPFNAKYVVRYLLAPRGAYGGDSVFPETDQVWGALPTQADNVLRLPVSDTNIFFPPMNDLTKYGFGSDISDTGRRGTCFYSYKYEVHGNNKPLALTTNSTRLTGSLEHLANILRKSERCYIYEVTSALTEAALCGCPVTLVRTPYFNVIDPTCMMGDVRWSDGEIVKECANYLPEYQKFIDDFPKQLENFIRKTQIL
jgi:hypothetical protein